MDVLLGDVVGRPRMPRSSRSCCPGKRGARRRGCSPTRRTTARQCRAHAERRGVRGHAVNVEVRRHLARDGPYRSLKNAPVGLYGRARQGDVGGRALAGLLGSSARDDELAKARGAAVRRAGRRGELGVGDDARGLPRRGSIVVGERAKEHCVALLA